jgi:nitrite reductase/ring-hydroxylating ferredoxin subunit
VPEKVKVAKASDLVEGGGISVQLNGKAVALFKVSGQVYAIDGTCPHRGGPLAEGFLQGTKVSCPWHGWTFDVTTGAHSMNPSVKQPCMAASIEGEDVFLTV